MALPVELVLANDLLDDPRVPPLQDEAHPSFEQSIQGGVRDAVAGVEANNEPRPSLLQGIQVARRRSGSRAGPTTLPGSR